MDSSPMDLDSSTYALHRPGIPVNISPPAPLPRRTLFPHLPQQTRQRSLLRPLQQAQPPLQQTRPLLQQAQSSPQQAPPSSPPQAPPSSARKRSYEEFAAEPAKITVITPLPPSAAGLQPPRRLDGKIVNLYYSSRNLLASIWGYITGAYQKKIVAVEIGENGNKRRAIEAELSPSQLTKTLPGTFPEPQASPSKQEMPPPPPPQLETPPDSRPSSSQENKERDTPMAGQATSRQSAASAQAPPHQQAAAQAPLQPQAVSQTISQAAPVGQAAPSVPRFQSEWMDGKPLTVRAWYAMKAGKGPNDKLEDAAKDPKAPVESAPSLPQERVVRRLPLDSLREPSPPSNRAMRVSTTTNTLSPQHTKNAERDAKVDAQIVKMKNVMQEPDKDRSHRESIRRRLEASITAGRRVSFRADKETLQGQTGSVEVREDAPAVTGRRRQSQRAAKKLEAARLKREQEAIEAQLQEEAAKQLQEEERQAELRKALEEQARISDPEYIKKQQLIRPLDAEWETKVNAEMAVKSRTHVVTKTVDGTDLTRKDFGTLLPQPGTDDNPNGWLNDEIVNGWMSTIVARKLEQTNYVRSINSVPAFAAMPSAWYSNYRKQGGMQNISRWSRRKGIKGEKLLQCNKIFFPINTGAHWLLLIISPKERTLELLDSLNGSAKRWFAIGREWLEMELGSKYDPKEWKGLPSRSSEQMNSNDCGVFTCFNALASAKAVDFEELDKGDMRDARRLLGAILLNGGFFGDYEL